MSPGHLKLNLISSKNETACQTVILYSFQPVQDIKDVVIFFRLVKMASTSSMSCSSHATACYITEQIISMFILVDDHSLNVLAADTQFEILFVVFDSLS